jgi:hypothetical protein
MRGGKRKGAGRKPRYGNYKDTTTMRVPVELKPEIVSFIENLCGQRGRDENVAKTKEVGNGAENENVTKTDSLENACGNENVTISGEAISRAGKVLRDSLGLRANAGGAIKKEIRVALDILQS